jgi:hypothetical protein
MYVCIFRTDINTYTYMSQMRLMKMRSSVKMEGSWSQSRRHKLPLAAMSLTGKERRGTERRGQQTRGTRGKKRRGSRERRKMREGRKKARRVKEGSEGFFFNM